VPLAPIDHLRAALISLHVLAVLVLSLPAPPASTDLEDLEDPVLQQVLTDWAGLARGLGWALSDEEAAEIAVAGAQALGGARQRVAAPFARYAAITGAKQGWGMFGYLNRRPARLSIEVEEGGAWRLLYRARQRGADWRAAQLDSERFRAFINRHSWGRSRPGYEQLVDWLACQAGRDLPAATRLKVEMLRTPLPPPGRVLAEGGVPVSGAFWTVERALPAPCRGDG
jgi:hypothetical protein